MTTAQYPIRPQAFEGESILGYLKRTAKVLGSDTVRDVVREFDPPDLIWKLPFAWSLDRLAAALGDQWETLQSGLLGNDIPHLVHFRGQVISRDWVRNSKMWICPECLAERPFHRHIWYLGPLNSCHIHGRTLLNRCPNCEKHEFSWNTPGLDMCRHCHLPFISMRGREVDQRSREAMAIIHAIATGGEHPTGSILRGLTMDDQLNLLLTLGHVATYVEGHAYVPGTTQKSTSQSDLIGRGVELLQEWPTRLFSYLDRLMEKNAHEQMTSVMRLNPAQRFIELRPDDGWRHLINAAFREYLPPKGFERPKTGPLKHARSLFV